MRKIWAWYWIWHHSISGVIFRVQGDRRIKLHGNIPLKVIFDIFTKILALKFKRKHIRVVWNMFAILNKGKINIESLNLKLKKRSNKLLNNFKKNWCLWNWCMMLALLEFMLLRIALILHSDGSYCIGQITGSEQEMPATLLTP